MMALEFVILITIATGAGAPYCKIIYPCFFVSLLAPVYLFLKSSKIHLKAGFFSIAVSLALYGTTTAHAEKIRDNNIGKEKREIIKESERGRNDIFIRDYAGAYDDLPFLSSSYNKFIAK